MEWPPYSLDLNPIKNLWFLLKETMHQNHPELLTMPGKVKVLKAFIAAVKDTRENIPKCVHNLLCNSIVKLVQAVIKAEGWYTRYQFN